MCIRDSILTNAGRGLTNLLQDVDQKFAEANNATIVIIAGKNELADGKYRVKDMKTGKEELVKKESVINFIKELI